MVGWGVAGVGGRASSRAAGAQRGRRSCCPPGPAARPVDGRAAQPARAVQRKRAPPAPAVWDRWWCRCRCSPPWPPPAGSRRAWGQYGGRGAGWGPRAEAYERLGREQGACCPLPARPPAMCAASIQQGAAAAAAAARLGGGGAPGAGGAGGGVGQGLAVARGCGDGGGLRDGTCVACGAMQQGGQLACLHACTCSRPGWAAGGGCAGCARLPGPLDAPPGLRPPAAAASAMALAAACTAVEVEAWQGRV